MLIIISLIISAIDLCLIFKYNQYYKDNKIKFEDGLMILIPYLNILLLLALILDIRNFKERK